MRNIFPILALFAVAVAGITGCAAKPDWTKQGASASQTEKDWSQCRAMADQQTGRWSEQDSSSPLSEYDRRKAATSNKAIIDGCMRGRGYFPLKPGKG